jgi:hypothetical protein
VRTRETAKIIVDTEPAGVRLTPETVGAIRAVLAGFDERGWLSSIFNEHLAIIRRVPVHLAEDVASALVNILGCHVNQQAG